MTTTTAPRRKRRRLLALASIGLALVVGISVTTLAAWQDHEYVFGGSGNANGNGFGSTLLSIELSLDGGQTWTTVTTSPGGALTFGTNASLLTPGDTVYASVLLRAAVGSRGATVSLGGASLGSGSSLLNLALNYGAKVGSLADVTSSCNSNSYASLGSVLVGLNSLLTSGSGSTTFAVPAATSSAAGTPVGVCFAVALPNGVSNTLGGLNALPIWHFDATSN